MGAGPRLQEPDHGTDLGTDQKRLGQAVAIVFLLGIVGVLIFSGYGYEPLAAAPSEVVVVPNDSVITLPTRWKPRLVLSGRQEITLGDFVTTEPVPGSKAEEGFLLKALSVNETETETTLKTRPASLFEAVPQGSLVANPSDFEVKSNPGIAVRSEPAPLRSDVALLHRLPLPRLRCAKETETLDLRPSFKPKFKPVFDMRWSDRKGLRKRIETAEAGVRGDLRAVVKGEVGGTFSCKLKPEVVIPLFVAAVPAGPVPVPLKVVVNAAPTLGGELGSKIHTELEVGVRGFGGIEYDGKKLHPKGELVPRVRVEPPAIKSTATANMGITPRITVEAGWNLRPLGKLAAVAKLTFPTSIKLSYERGRKPPAKACIPLEMEGAIKFHLPGRRPLSSGSPKLTLLEKCFAMRQEDRKGASPPEAAD